MDFDRIFQHLMVVLIMLFFMPFLLGSETTVGNPLEVIFDLVGEFAPVLVSGIFLYLLFKATEAVIELDTFDSTIEKINLKFWEWSLIKYLAFTVGIIVITTIINKPFGFVVSLVLLVIAIFLRIPYEYKKAKERA